MMAQVRLCNVTRCLLRLPGLWFFWSRKVSSESTWQMTERDDRMPESAAVWTGSRARASSGLIQNRMKSWS